MELNKNSLQTSFEDFRGFWGDLWMLVIQEKFGRWYEHFQRNYPEVFTVKERWVLNSESNELGTIDLRNQTWLKLRKGLLMASRTADRFPDYESVMDDLDLTTKQKIIHLQWAIDDGTRRKVYFASLQGQLLQSCFFQSKKNYKKTFGEVGIKNQWGSFFVSCTNSFKSTAN